MLYPWNIGRADMGQSLLKAFYQHQAIQYGGGFSVHIHFALHQVCFFRLRYKIMSNLPDCTKKSPFVPNECMNSPSGCMSQKSGYQKCNIYPQNDYGFRKKPYLCSQFDKNMQYELIISNTIETIHISGMDIMCFKADGNYSHMILCEGEERIISWQLGQLEDLIYEQLGDDASLFVRIGRGIIVNREYIYVINLQKQELILRSHNGFKIEHNASKESLKQLKDHIEKYSIKKYGGHG